MGRRGKKLFSLWGGLTDGKSTMRSATEQPKRSVRWAKRKRKKAKQMVWGKKKGTTFQIHFAESKAIWMLSYGTSTTCSKKNSGDL